MLLCSRLSIPWVELSNFKHSILTPTLKWVIHILICCVFWSVIEFVLLQGKKEAQEEWVASTIFVASDHLVHVLAKNMYTRNQADGNNTRFSETIFLLFSYRGCSPSFYSLSMGSPRQDHAQLYQVVWPCRSSSTSSISKRLVREIRAICRRRVQPPSLWSRFGVPHLDRRTQPALHAWSPQFPLLVHEVQLGVRRGSKCRSFWSRRRPSCPVRPRNGKHLAPVLKYCPLNAHWLFLV